MRHRLTPTNRRSLPANKSDNAVDVGCAGDPRAWAVSTFSTWCVTFECVNSREAKHCWRLPELQIKQSRLVPTTAKQSKITPAKKINAIYTYFPQNKVVTTSDLGAVYHFIPFNMSSNSFGILDRFECSETPCTVIKSNFTASRCLLLKCLLVAVKSFRATE